MARLIWVALLVFCLVAVQAKKKAKLEPKEKVEDAETEGDSKLKTSQDSEAPEGSDDAEAEAENADDAPAPTEGEEKVNGKENEKQDTEKELNATNSSEEEENEEATSEISEKKSSDDKEDSEDSETKKGFSCNLKFKKIGCYADKSKKQKPLASFIMSDADMGTISKKGKLPKEDTFNTELPKFACKCANEAINAGNAIFGLQNIAECWTGPDNSKYDKDGESDNCVAFDYKPCAGDSEICAGKKHANFVYYIDTPEHTKSPEEIKKENDAAANKKKKELQKKADRKKKAKKALKKKSKKSKKSKQ